MQVCESESPQNGLDMSFSRRAALGGLLAAVLTPAMMIGTGPAIAQQAGAPVVIPVPRVDSAAVMMGDGSVLVTGGRSKGILGDAQILNISTGGWSYGGTLNTPRAEHAAALLPGGQAIVCGGINYGVLADTEIFDPTTGLWTVAASMNVPRRGHSAASVAGGVIVYGGENLGTLAAPEFFNGSVWTLL